MNQVSPIHKSRVTTLGIQLSPTRDQPPSQGRKAFGVSHRICDQQSSPRLLVKANSNRSSREGLINMTDTAVLDIGLALTWPWRAENISVLPSGSVTVCTETNKNACTWLREFCSCSCLTALPGFARLCKIYIPFCSPL